MTQGRDEPPRLHAFFFNLLWRMPQVELTEDGHAAMTTVARHLFLVVFVMVAVHTVQGVLRDYRYARSILRDHGVATAKPGNAASPEGAAEGLDPSRFTFAVDGATYSATFATDEVEVQVAYVRGHPGRFDRLDVLEDKGSLFRLMLGTLGAVPFFAMTCWASFVVLTRFVFRIGRWSDLHGRLRNRL